MVAGVAIPNLGYTVVQWCTYHHVKQALTQNTIQPTQEMKLMKLMKLNNDRGNRIHPTVRQRLPETG